MNSILQDFYRRNEVGFFFVFSSEKNERKCCETVPATSTQFFSKEIREHSRSWNLAPEEAMLFALSEKERSYTDMAN